MEPNRHILDLRHWCHSYLLYADLVWLYHHYITLMGKPPESIWVTPRDFSILCYTEAIF